MRWRRNAASCAKTVGNPFRSISFSPSWRFPIPRCHLRASDVRKPRLRRNAHSRGCSPRCRMREMNGYSTTAATPTKCICVAVGLSIWFWGRNKFVATGFSRSRRPRGDLANPERKRGVLSSPLPLQSRFAKTRVPLRVTTRCSGLGYYERKQEFHFRLHISTQSL